MIRLTGATEFKSALLGTIAKEQVATRAAVSEAAHLIEKTAKQKLGLTSHERGTPTPSSPGEPPSLVSGNLRRSVKVDTILPAMVNGHPGWKTQIGPTAVYGRIQELGGDTGYSSLPPRPYLKPAYDEVHPLLKDIFKKHWRGPLML